MPIILHLLDDTALGGVTRLLNSLTQSFGNTGSQEIRSVETGWRPAPMLRSAGARPDIIVVHFTAAWRKLPFLASLRLRASGARIILVEHSYTGAFEERCVRHKGRFRAMLRLAYRMVDQVVAVSHGQTEWLMRAGLVTQDRLVVIPCVLDLAAFSALPLPQPPTLPMRLGAFGRFAPQKGFDILISAMRDVPPDIATLELAGYGPDEGSLRAAAAGLPHVRIRDRVDPVAFLAGLDAVTMPSRWEAGAVACWEARAAGRPMIVTDVDGLPEQVPPSIGIVVPPENAARLAAAIIDLAQADRSAMAHSARHSTQGAYGIVLAAWQAILD
jgi:glycosyltransferase involved in cell wall biosynthesis